MIEALERAVRNGWLLDFYGGLLTEHQRQVLALKYEEDLSQTEIAEQLGISRQGVHDALKKGEALLWETESKLGLVARHIALQKALREIGRELASAEQGDGQGIVRAAQAVRALLEEGEHGV